LRGRTAEPPRRTLDALRQELRRGTLVLGALAVLNEERHGADVRDALVAAGLPIDDGALYPMLRRLEEQGLLASEWRIDGSRKKRFYLLSPAGSAALAELTVDWRAQAAAVTALLKGSTL
jgi:PadR family transcriptional regulator, regulatory protein PadR